MATCRNCGATGLMWQSGNRGYYLTNSSSRRDFHSNSCAARQQREHASAPSESTPVSQADVISRMTNSSRPAAKSKRDNKPTGASTSSSREDLAKIFQNLTADPAAEAPASEEKPEIKITAPEDNKVLPVSSELIAELYELANSADEQARADAQARLIAMFSVAPAVKPYDQQQPPAFAAIPDNLIGLKS